MGWCSEFGVEISPCDHAMVAGSDACHCDVCGARCEGRFEGCPDVWARGPVQVNFVRAPSTPRPHRRATPPDDAVDEVPAPSAHHENGIGEVLGSVQRLEDRLNTLEASVLDAQSAAKRDEVAELLEKLPRRLGEEIRAALDDRESERIGRIDDAIGRLQEALVAVETSANRAAEASRVPRARGRQRGAAAG